MYLFEKPKFLGFLILLILPSLIFGPAIPEVLLLISIIIFFYQILKKNNLNIFNNYFFLFFIIFNILLIFNSFFSVEKLKSLESSLFYFRFILYALIIFYLLQKFKSFEKYLFYLLFFIFFILSFDSIIQFIFGKNLIGFQIDQRMNQVTSFFGDEKKLGSFIVRLLPFYIFLYFKIANLKKIKHNILFILSIIFFSIPVIFSGERTAIFLLIILLSFLCIFNYLNIINKIFTIILFFLIFVITVLAIPSLKKRIVDHTLDEFSFNDKQITIFSAYHTSHLLTAFNMFIDRPIIGHGTKTFRILCDKPPYEIKIYAIKPEFIDLYDSKINIILQPQDINHVIESGNGCSTHPHNTYFQLISETGLIGFSIIFFIFTLVSIIILKNLFFIFRKDYSFGTHKSVYLFIAIFLNYFPFTPSGNFFNNWLNFLYFFPYGFLLYYYLINTKYFYVFKK